MPDSLRRFVATRRLPALAFLVLSAASLCAACQSKASPPPAAPTVSTDTWVVVDGRQITRDQVEKAFRRVRDSSQALSDEEALTAKLTLLNDMIVQDLLLAKAQALKIEVSESELDNAFAEAKKRIPADAFDQELTKRNLTAADMRDGLRRDLLTQKVIEREVGSKIAVTDKEVTDFFNANRTQFNLAEDSIHLGQILITPVREAQITNRTGDDATNPQAAAAKAAMLVERFKAGANFGDLAMDYSEDTQTAPRGGDLGLMPMSALQRVPASLREAAMKGAPGSVTVVSEGGAHVVVFVVAREAKGQRDLSTPGVRERITETLKTRREQLLRAAYLADLRNDADVTNHVARRVVESQGKP